MEREATSAKHQAASCTYAAPARRLQRLITFHRVINLEVDPGHPRHAGIQPTVGVQAQPAVAGRTGVDLELFTARSELHAGGRRRQQAHSVALTIELLMDMPPEHRTHLTEAIQHGE